MAAMRKDGLRTEYVDGELFVHDEQTGTTHALNASAAAVFELCDGVTSDEAIAEVIGSRTNTAPDVQLVSLAIRDLEEAGLITVVGERPSKSLSRRQLIQRIGAGAAAIAALPVVEAVVGGRALADDASAGSKWGYTPSPTRRPTARPTDVPTSRPTDRPTGVPTSRPTGRPTSRPTGRPTSRPTGRPTSRPTGKPTRRPTPSPTGTNYPTPSPTPGQSAEVCVRELLAEVLRLAKRRHLHRGGAAILAWQLKGALHDIRGGKKRRACRHLRAFVRTVRWLQRSRRLEPSHGQSLINRARRCKELLGCGRRRR